MVPVPDRQISTNPRSKFGFVFVFYLPMYCLEEDFVLSLRLYLGVKAQTYFVSSSRMFLDNKKTRKPCLKFFTCVVILQKYIPHHQQLWTFKGECQITTMEADFLSKGTKSHSFWFPIEHRSMRIGCDTTPWSLQVLDCSQSPIFP